MLDKKRPYATIFGESVAKYEQDGKEFDHTGKELKPEGEAKTKSKPRTTKPKAQANGDFDGMNIPQLQKALKDKTGKGARPGTPRAEILARLQA